MTPTRLILWILISMALIAMFVDLCEAHRIAGVHVHVPLMTKRKLKKAAKIGGIGLLLAKHKLPRAMIPLPIPFPLPIPIIKTYQPIIHPIGKLGLKLGAIGGLGFGGFHGGLGFGGLHGGLGAGGHGFGGLGGLGGFGK